jgi:hypothetical protein
MGGSLRLAFKTAVRRGFQAIWLVLSMAYNSSRLRHCRG